MYPLEQRHLQVEKMVLYDKLKHDQELAHVNRIRLHRVAHRQELLAAYQATRANDKRMPLILRTKT